MSATAPTVIQWILDTRELWTDATETRQLEDVAPRELALLNETERQKVLSYVFARDAKLCLGSCLLKRFVISKFCHVPWPQALATADGFRKPVFLDNRDTQPLDFNISHQDGLVALAAVHGHAEPIDVGVDVVSMGERRARDHAELLAKGWAQFVDVYADIFAPEEMAYLKDGVHPPGALATERQVDFRLRYFYALWCLREAFVKMDGQALSAPWIQQLEFRNFHPPQPVELYGAGFGGAAVRDFEVILQGKKVEDVRVELRSMAPHYMIGTAVRTPPSSDASHIHLGSFRKLDLESILDYALAG